MIPCSSSTYVRSLTFNVLFDDGNFLVVEVFIVWSVFAVAPSVVVVDWVLIVERLFDFSRNFCNWKQSLIISFNEIKEFLFIK